MACNCKNKVNSYVDISKVQEQSWEDVNTLLALDSCNEIIVAEKPDTLSEEDREKVNTIRLKGKGRKALYDDGEYKHTYTSSDIDNQLKNYDTSEQVDKKLEKFDDYYNKEEIDKNLSSVLENYYTKDESDNHLSNALEDYYTQSQVDSAIENAVFYDAENNIKTKNNLVLGEKHKIIAKQSSGQDKRLFNIIDASNWDNLELGSDQVKFNIKSKSRPSVQLHGEENLHNIAFQEEIQQTEDNLQNQLNQVNQELENHIQNSSQFKSETNSSIQNMDERITANSQDIALNASHIQSLRDDFNAAEHFKGYFETYLQIQNIPGEQGAFAWCAQTGTVWIYDSNLKTWIDAQIAIPDQTVQAYDANPLMDSEAASGSSNQYARGDHTHPSDITKADKNKLEDLELAFNEHLENSDNFNEAVSETFDTINEAINELDEKVKTNTQAIALNTSDIQTLTDNFNAAEHFKGYFETYIEIQNIPGEQGAFAWCAQTGTVWIYDSSDKTWKDTETEIPDQTVYASDAFPIMDGKAAPGSSNLYARGDHRHPSDTTKADKEDLKDYIPLAGNTPTTQMTGDIWLGTKQKIFVTDSGNSYLGQEENTQTTILRGFGGGGIELQTEIGDVKYNGAKIATVNDIPDSNEFVINGENEKDVIMSVPKMQVITDNAISLIHQKDLQANNLSVNSYGIYASTYGNNKLYYNGSEVATKDDLLTESEKGKIASICLEGEGTKFLADDGNYKELDIDTNQFVVNGSNEDNLDIFAPHVSFTAEGSLRLEGEKMNLQSTSLQIHASIIDIITPENSFYYKNAEVANKNDLSPLESRLAALEKEILGISEILDQMEINSL